MNKNGFGKYKPNLYLSKDNGIETKLSRIKYPAILKPFVGHTGNGIMIIDEWMDIPDNHIVEQYIPGTMEYGLHLEIKDGKILKSICFVSRQKEYFIKRGAMLNYEIMQFGTDLFDRIFCKTKYTGFACANFKIKECIKIFEINPRKGATLIIHESLNE